MTKKELTEIMELLQGFYPSNSLFVENMAKAWINLIGGFDFKIVKNAIVEFASQDVREINAIPAPGVIYQAIEKTYVLYEAIKQIAKEGLGYAELNETAKDLISKENYNKLLLMDASEIEKYDITKLAK